MSSQKNFDKELWNMEQLVFKQRENAFSLKLWKYFIKVVALVINVSNTYTIEKEILSHHKCKSKDLKVNMLWCCAISNIIFILAFFQMDIIQDIGSLHFVSNWNFHRKLVQQSILVCPIFTSQRSAIRQINTIFTPTSVLYRNNEVSFASILWRTFNLLRHYRAKVVKWLAVHSRIYQAHQVPYYLILNADLLEIHRRQNFIQSH